MALLDDATRFSPCAMFVSYEIKYKMRTLVIQKHRSDTNADVVSEKIRWPEGAQKGIFVSDL